MIRMSEDAALINMCDGFRAPAPEPFDVKSGQKLVGSTFVGMVDTLPRHLRSLIVGFGVLAEHAIVTEWIEAAGEKRGLRDLDL